MSTYTRSWALKNHFPCFNAMYIIVILVFFFRIKLKHNTYFGFIGKQEKNLMKRFRRVGKNHFSQISRDNIWNHISEVWNGYIQTKIVRYSGSTEKTSMLNGECFPNIHKIASLQKLPIWNKYMLRGNGGIDLNKS